MLDFGAIQNCQYFSFSDSPKFTHFVNKVSEVVLKVKDDKILTESLNTLSMLREVSTLEKKSLIEKTLAWILTEYPKNNVEKYQELYESVLASVIKDTDLLNRQDYYRKYLRILYDLKKFNALLIAAQDMYTQFRQDTCSLGELLSFNHFLRYYILTQYK